MPREDVERIIRQEPLENLYDVGNELGRGKFAIVKKCTEKSTGEPFAVKVLKKRRRGKSCRDDILLEIDIMRQANEAREHPRIIRLHEVFESSSEFHIILELATGGELFRVIAIDPLPEDKAREVVYQIVDGVQHLHMLNIVHLDLKPENILLYRKGSLDIKIADFGLSVQVKEGQEMKTLVGTAEYVSPEILNFESLSTFTDMWSIGALTYALLTGYSPFQGETHQETFLNVSQCDYDFDDDIFDVVSAEAKDFIERLLIKAPRKRMSATKCLEHAWMKTRKNNLNSSTSSLDSALCMDSPSSVEPSPASSTSSSFSPAPSSTISHSNTATTSTVTTSSSPVMPFSQPEDMSEVNKKLAHISSLATSSLSANEAGSTSAAIKLRDDEGSPTSTDSSTSTLKEAPSSENIPVLAGGDVDSSAMRSSKERSCTPSEPVVTPESEVPKVARDGATDADIVVTNGKDTRTASNNSPILKEQKEVVEDKQTGKEREEKRPASMKYGDKDATKNEEDRLDMILNGVKSDITGYNRTKKSDYDLKGTRLDRSKALVSSGSDALLSNSTSRLPSYRSTTSSSSSSSLLDSKEQKTERQPEETAARNKERSVSPSTSNPLAAPSSTGTLIESQGSSSSYLSSGGRSLTLTSHSPRTVSPALESYATSRTSTRDRKNKNKTESADERLTVKDDSILINKEEEKPVSQRVSPVIERPLSREESPRIDKVAESSQLESVKEKSSLDKDSVVDTTSKELVEKVSPVPGNEMSERERKRLERMKRRGSVERVMKMKNKAKQQLNEERRTSSSDDTASSTQEQSVGESKKIDTESPARVASPSHLTPNKNTTSSPKAKHRPTTPEPMSPTITNVKLLQSPERRTRRKSEGMRPIERRLMRMAPQDETLHEEGSSEDEEIANVTSSSDTPCPQGDEKKDEVTTEDAKPVKVDDQGSKPAAVQRQSSTASKYTSCTANAFTVNTPAFTTEETTRPYISREREEESVKCVSPSAGDRPGSTGSLRRRSTSSPVSTKIPSTASTQASTGVTSPTSTTEQMDRGERASSRPSSRSSSRPSSRTDSRQTSGEKELKNKPPSPVPSATPPIQRQSSVKSSKYTSCTANAFTVNTSVFTAEETRPYTSVLRRSESTKSKSVSSLARTPIDDAWRYETGTTYTPTRRLSATPVRGRVAETGDLLERTSPDSRIGRLGSRHAAVEENGKMQENNEDSFPDTKKAAGSLSANNNGRSESTRNGRDDHFLGSPPSSRHSPRRAFVKREEMVEKDDSSSSSVTATSSRNTLSVDGTNKVALSEPAKDSNGPDIVVRLPSVSDETSQSKPPVVSSQGQSTVEDVILRTHKCKLSNPKRASWRQTPEISPDVVDMILKGEIFDSDEDCENLLRPKLETCVEENDEEIFSPTKKFTPPGSRSSSRTGKRTPILKTSKPSSPENGLEGVKLSVSSAPEKKVSINEDAAWIEGRETSRKKFRSTGDRSYSLGAKSESIDEETIPVIMDREEEEEKSRGETISPLPDPLSISMDMRSDSLLRLRAHSLSHSSSTPDLTQITGVSKKASKAKRVERSNSKRQFGRVRVDTYLDQSLSHDPQTPTSPSRRSGTVTMSPRHSTTSLSSRIKSSFSRWGERDKDKNVEVKNRGNRTLK